MHIEPEIQVTIQRLRTAQQKNKNYRKAIKQLQMAYDRQRYHAERLLRTNDQLRNHIDNLNALWNNRTKPLEIVKTPSWRFWKNAQD